MFIMLNKYYKEWFIGKDNNWEDKPITNTLTRFNEVRRQYILALGRERYNLYQSNMGSF